MPAKGKLVDRYYNQLRTLRIAGVLAKKRKTSYNNSNTEETIDYDGKHFIYLTRPCFMSYVFLESGASLPLGSRMFVSY